MKTKRLVSLALAVLMSVALFAGCGKTEGTPTTAPQSGSTTSASAPVEPTGNSDYLVWNIGSEPKTWDPNLGNENTSDMLDTNLFEALTYQSVDGIEPGVAETWDVSEDGLTYTFHLRKDAKWSDGTPVTANDFYYAWMRMCDPESASPAAAGLIDYIAGAREYFTGTGKKEDVKLSVPDDYTFVCTLLNALPYWPAQIAGYNYCPVKAESVAAGEGWEKRPETAISNGPFVLEEYQIGSHLLLKKNEHYWDAANVKLAGIKCVMVQDANTALQGFEAGDIQANDVIPKEEMPRLIAENPNLYIGPNPGTYFIEFNCDNEITGNVLVRKALALAVDRKMLTEQITRAGEVPATGFLPLSCYKSDSTAEYRTLDESGFPVPQYGIDPTKALVDEAKELLKQAGYPDGKGLEIDIIYNTSDNHKKIMEAVQQMWTENLGIKVTLRNEEWNVFLDTREQGKYQAARAGWIGSYYDASSMLKQFVSTSGSNDIQWRWQAYKPASWDTKLNPENKKFDELYNKAMSLSGAERDAAWVACEDYFMEYMPVCPLYYYTLPVLIDLDKCEGVEIAKNGQWLFKHAELLAN